MIKHLTYDEEIFWFRAVVAGEQEAIDLLESPQAQASWKVADAVPAADVLADYRLEIERSNAIVAATALDSPPAWWPGDLFGDCLRSDDEHGVATNALGNIVIYAPHQSPVRKHDLPNATAP